MALPVILSETAFKTFESICVQIKDRLGNMASEDFKKNTLKFFELISISPFMFKQTNFDLNIGHGLIKNISSVFYEVKLDRIEILFFWDNRQEPMFY